MTNYHLNSPADPLSYSAWQEKKEQRKKLLETTPGREIMAESLL
jgi:hypothetical protein